MKNQPFSLLSAAICCFVLALPISIFAQNAVITGDQSPCPGTATYTVSYPPIDFVA
jgi:hypothetical protein